MGIRFPTPDDNILGHVPDLVKQLEAAEQFGGDVQIPLSDWLAKTDPEVRKALRDDVRVRPGGMTLNEAEPPASVDAAPKEEPETIASAAVRNTDTGEVFTGATHADAFSAGEKAAKDAGKEFFAADFARDGGGFVTNTGTYVSREQALEIADKNDQLKYKPDRLHARDFKDRPPPIDPLDGVRRGAGLDPMAAPEQIRLQEGGA